MEAELMALAAMCASSLTGLALQDLWGWGRKRFARLLGRDAPEETLAAEAELDHLRQDLLEARRTGDEDAEAVAEEAWTRRFHDLLAENPEAAARVRAVVGEVVARSPAPVAFANILHYVNNASVLRAMTDHRARCAESGAMTALFLCGLPGVGKRTTARHWLRSQRDTLPDEVLQADLAPDDRGRPADLAAVLEGWLDQLGVPRDDRPADVGPKADEVRRQLRHRPMVVLLENVSTLAQIRALLPDSPLTVLLMTGHQAPKDLVSALDYEPVDVEPLEEAHALDLLVKVSRSTESPDRLRPVVRQLGGLPLAVRLVAGQLKSPVPGVLEDITALLADRGARRELLSMDGPHGLPGPLDLTYEQLGAEAALLYRRLGVLPRVDFQTDTVFALTTDRQPAAVRRALRELISARLVERAGLDTHRLHPLVHDHAATVAERVDGAAGHTAVRGLVVGHYLRTAEAGEAALSSRWRYDPTGAYAPAAERMTHPERELLRRRAGLLAAVRLAHEDALHAEAWRLCQALWTVYLRTASHAEWIESHEIGLASALETGDRTATARMHYQLGFAHLDRWSIEEDDPRRAREHLEAALDLVSAGATDRDGDEGWRRTRSSALEGLGLLEQKLRRPRHALDRFDRAEAALDGVHHPRGLALLAYHRAPALTALGRHDDAEATLRTARERFAALGSGKDIALNIGKSWTRSAQDRLAAGRPRDALTALDAAVAALEDAESAYVLAAARLLRGDVRRDLGDLVPAIADWEAARDGFTALRSGRADEARDRLAAVRGEQPSGEDGGLQ